METQLNPTGSELEQSWTFIFYNKEKLSDKENCCLLPFNCVDMTILCWHDNETNIISKLKSFINLKLYFLLLLQANNTFKRPSPDPYIGNDSPNRNNSTMKSKPAPPARKPKQSKKKKKKDPNEPSKWVKKSKSLLIASHSLLVIFLHFNDSHRVVVGIIIIIITLKQRMKARRRERNWWHGKLNCCTKEWKPKWNQNERTNWQHFHFFFVFTHCRPFSIRFFLLIIQIEDNSNLLNRSPFCSEKIVSRQTFPHFLSFVCYSCFAYVQSPNSLSHCVNNTKNRHCPLLTEIT